MLCTLNLSSDIYQLFLNKTGKKIQLHIQVEIIHIQFTEEHS